MAANGKKKSLNYIIIDSEASKNKEKKHRYKIENGLLNPNVRDR